MREVTCHLTGKELCAQGCFHLNYLPLPQLGGLSEEDGETIGWKGDPFLSSFFEEQFLQCLGTSALGLDTAEQ